MLGVVDPADDQGVEQVVDFTAFQLRAQPGIGALHLITRRPPSRHPGIERVGDHLAGKGGFGREFRVIGNTCVLSTLGVVRPGLRQIPGPIDQRVPRSLA